MRSRAPVPLALALLLSGCMSSMGYIPPTPANTANIETLIPSYPEVKAWSYDVHLALISRTMANRTALYAGGTLAVAGSAALAGLVAMGSASPALAVIPLVTGALGAGATLYQNSAKADLYERAGHLVMVAILASDARVAAGAPAGLLESTCLRRDVYAILHRVGRHLTYLDPQQVPMLLANVKAGAVSVDATEVKAATGDLSDLDAFASVCDPPPPVVAPAPVPRFVPPPTPPPPVSSSAPPAPARVPSVAPPAPAAQPIQTRRETPDALWAHPSAQGPVIRAMLDSLAPPSPR